MLGIFSAVKDFVPLGRKVNQYYHLMIMASSHFILFKILFSPELQEQKVQLLGYITELPHWYC